MTAEASRPFCGADPAAVACFDGWRGRLEGLGVVLDEADLRVVGLVASRETRLEQLAAAVAGELDGGAQLRLVEAERKAWADVVAAFDLVERTFGGVVAEAVARPAALRATGTSGPAPRVLAFAGASDTKPRTTTGQRIAAAVCSSSAPLTFAGLRRAVKGSQNDLRAGLRDALACGAIRREGRGSKGRPYLYRPGGSR